jgi:type I restriction enzyme R subunit
MNEADTRVRLIEPKLVAAGWTEQQVTREFYYQRDYQYTRGRIILVGDRIKRGEAKKVDYLLRYTDGFPIAVIEAKSDEEPAEKGLEQAKGYAQDLGLYFAFATNGNEIIEYDFFTNASRDIERMPSPHELWERWKINTGIKTSEELHDIIKDQKPTSLIPALRANPLLHPYCPESQCGKKPFYFQEVAIREVVKRLMRGQKRVLLAMATGTGKTFIAFQICWKLIKSGWLKLLHPDQPARILFLADRIVLRNQAFNTFSPFADGTSDPRFLIEGHPPNFRRDLYFGIYQTLWSPDEDGTRLFELFPPDFFDLIIIDECHRSGFGTWREILDHFGEAIHLGMTATPKRDENIDTYAYFCSEEPEIAIDPHRPELGTRRPPAFEYSMGRGIEDGFLATYKVHQVRTTVDITGLHLQDAIEQGAEVFVPEDVEPRELYTTPQFEREITLPDRTRAMTEHLANLLRRFGPLDKTMVFCVDMDHARLVARLLQDHFGPDFGIDNYALPIISEEGEEARRWLEDFADSDKKTPVVATTAELLSTGVDVPACKNIVFMKTLSSPILFKQIIGRGSRIDQATDKYWFRIIDYTGASRLFDEWDRPMGPAPEIPKGPFTASLEGRVFHADTGDLIVGASVSVRIGPNVQRGPILTDINGRFAFPELPVGVVAVICGAPGFVRREIRVETIADETISIEIALKPVRKGGGKIRVEGLEVTIAEEAVFLVEETGQQLTLNEYRDYTRRKIIGVAQDWRSLREIWVHPEKRRAFMEDLRRSSIHPDVLAEVLKLPEADTYDLLCHIAFGFPLRTRSERASAFRNREQDFIDRYGQDARMVILELLEKYRVAGIDQLSPEIFSVPPFRDWGGAKEISGWFGGPKYLGKALEEMQERIYPVTEVIK